MKREILFRGKSIEPSTEGKWRYGSLLVHGSCCYILPDNTINPLGIVKYRVDPETVGQFTGRYDKNDKEIFERDIVVNKNIHGKKWIVEYRTDSEYVGFVLKEIGTNGISLFTSWNDVEVIGNIHDNKELFP